MSPRVVRVSHLWLCLVLGAFVAGCASGPPPTLTELGWTALETGDWRAAKQHFGEALRVDSRNASAWHGQAEAQLSGRDPEAALRSLGSLSKVDSARFQGEARPTYANALEAATKQRLEHAQPEAALAAVRALAKLDPDRRGLSRLLGAALLAEADHKRLRGHPKAALGLYKEACRVAPAELEAWVGAVEILLERKKGREAMRLLEAARKSHPTAGIIRTLARQAMKYRKR